MKSLVVCDESIKTHVSEFCTLRHTQIWAYKYIFKHETCNTVCATPTVYKSCRTEHVSSNNYSRTTTDGGSYWTEQAAGALFVPCGPPLYAAIPVLGLIVKAQNWMDDCESKIERIKTTGCRENFKIKLDGLFVVKQGFK